MDTTADEPPAFRLRRSPSTGSGSATLPTARSTKRKLSITTFGSSPNVAPHPLPSPISAEHTNDNMERALHHTMVGSSSHASTSRNALPTADHSMSLPNHSDSAHEQSALINPERRCHTVLVDYDLCSSLEDRRDPRSSATCLVVNVGPPSQDMSLTQSHGASTHLNIQEVAPQSRHAASLHGTQGHLDKLEHSSDVQNVDSISNITNHDDANRGNVESSPLQSSLSQQTFSVQTPTEHRIASSSKFGCFYYQAARPQTTRSQAVEGGSEQVDENKPHSLVSLSRLSPQDVVHRPNTTSSGIKTDLDAHQQEKVWLRSTSAHSKNDDKFESQEKCQANSVWISNSGKNPSFANLSFQLHSVPPFKRRRADDSLDQQSTALFVVKNRNDQRRSSDAEKSIPQESPLAHLKTSASSRSNPTGSNVPILSVEHHLVASARNHGQTQPNDHTFSRIAPTLTTSPPELPSSSFNAPNPSYKRANLLPSPPKALQGSLPPVFHRKRASRSRRSQSVPNMRVKAVLDLSVASQHHVILPAYYSNSACGFEKNGRGTLGSNQRGTKYRSSKRTHVGTAHYQSGYSSARSRSTFVPDSQPPITRHTLRELDLFEILKNPQLRHDVVFDPNVQFRPNFDGERGRRKREAGERYWTAIGREIELGCTCTAYEHGKLVPCTCKSSRGTSTSLSTAQAGRDATNGLVASIEPPSRSPTPTRIPILVQELRAICLSILPSNFPASSNGSTQMPSNQPENEASKADGKAQGPQSYRASTIARSQEIDSTTTHHQLISTTLDSSVIAQELQHGVLDVPALITFMGSILKLHCAPMRDEAIEKMVKVVCVEHDIGKGLRLCFEILELMKLDIANHQLRSTRPYLVETAVDFEIRWFKEQIEQGKMSLVKTNAWLEQSLCKVKRSEESGLGLDHVSEAFHDGLLQLIFDVPGSISLLPSSAVPLMSPSSSSLNNTFASFYPETFQFDAYRMMTFHNDVADLTIVYMLLLLFRQLCCSPLDDSGPVPASANILAQDQLKTVKGEIWCLLNDANLCLSGSTAGAVFSKQTASFETKLISGSSGGFAKLEHPRWRRAMQNVLLQVAARAAAVQMAARQALADPSLIKPAAPSANTQNLLNAWMQSNFCAGSALHKLCQKRLRTVVLGMLGDKLRAASAAAGLETPTKLERSNLDAVVPSAGIQRAKISDGSGTSAAHGSNSVSTLPNEVAFGASWESSLNRAGLDPFAAEIRLLSDRISKVGIFHLRVFRKLYEKIDSERNLNSGETTPASTIVTT